MTANASHIRLRRRFFQFGFLFFFLLAVGILAGSFYRDPISTRWIEQDVHLDGVTPTDLAAFRENNPFFIPPQDLEKSREFVRQCEELWYELQEFKNEPDFAWSHLAEGTRYHDWLQRAGTLRNSLPPKEKIGSDVYALPGALIAAARDLAGGDSCRGIVVPKNGSPNTIFLRLEMPYNPTFNTFFTPMKTFLRILFLFLLMTPLCATRLFRPTH